MPAKRLSMRKIKEVLRLKWANHCSNRQIARVCSISRPTVADYLLRAQTAQLGWPLPPELDEGQLEQRLFPATPNLPASERGVPDWPSVYQDMRGKSVTLFLLWQEYRAGYPQGYQYSWFCQHYHDWLNKRDPVMRQHHRAGEKLFVDYAGQTIGVVDSSTGEIRDAQVFVATLGASNYTYAEATWTQTLPDWIASHQRAFQFIAGVTEVVVPDNLRAGVSKAHRYEPDINPTYQDMAAHYNVAVVPARVRRPRDKAKVEVAVQVVERWILAPLRRHTFFSLGELNQCIGQLLTAFNERPFQKLPGCRKSVFEAVDKPALKPLPTRPYQYAEWKKVRVHIDYHVEIDGHYYSVPYTLIKQQLEARMTHCTIECFHKGQRVASHPRSRIKGQHSTVNEHMPTTHRQYGDWSPQRLTAWAEKMGPATVNVVTHILSARVHPQQGYRTCLGILRLGKAYGEARLEAACQRAGQLGSYRYRSIESILKHRLENQPLPARQEQNLPQDHGNIRGADYYQ